MEGQEEEIITSWVKGLSTFKVYLLILFIVAITCLVAGMYYGHYRTASSMIYDCKEFINNSYSVCLPK